MTDYDKHQNDSFSSDGFYEYKEENAEGLSDVIEELSAMGYEFDKLDNSVKPTTFGYKD